MSEPAACATIDDLRVVLHRESISARAEPKALPMSREELAGLVPHLTLLERQRLERLLPRTSEEAVAGWLDDVIGEQGLAYRRLTDPELEAMYALMERLSGGPLLPEDLPDELRRGMPTNDEIERWIVVINAVGEKFARGGDAAGVISSITCDLSQLTIPELHALHALRWKLAGMPPEHGRRVHEECLQNINALMVTR
jgi:hypothetical protein